MWAVNGEHWKDVLITINISRHHVAAVSVSRVSALSAGTTSLRPRTSATPQAPQFLEKFGVLAINPAEYELNKWEITSCCTECSGCSVCTLKRRSELHCRERAGQKEQMSHCSPIYPWYEHFLPAGPWLGTSPCHATLDKWSPQVDLWCSHQTITNSSLATKSPSHRPAHRFFWPFRLAQGCSLPSGNAWHTWLDLPCRKNIQIFFQRSVLGVWGSCSYYLQVVGFIIIYFLVLGQYLFPRIGYRPQNGLYYFIYQKCMICT